MNLDLEAWIVRDRAVSVRVTPRELATLRRRATVHRLNVSAYLRAIALYDAAAARNADEWWAGLSPARRASVHQWLTEDHGPGPLPGQLPIETAAPQ